MDSPSLRFSSHDPTHILEKFEQLPHELIAFLGSLAVSTRGYLLVFAEVPKPDLGGKFWALQHLDQFQRSWKVVARRTVIERRANHETATYWL